MFRQQIVDFYRQTVEKDLRQSPFDATSRGAFEVWQGGARGRLTEILGAMPTERVGFDLERSTVEETEHYIRERLIYTTRPGLQATAYLTTPKNARFPAPAVFCLHGHSTGGKDEVVDKNSAYAGIGTKFAELGFVTLSPDQIGFGERAIPEGPVTYNVLVHGLNMLGHTLIGWRYWDLVRGLDLLESLDAVDPTRIGVMGLSLGGEMTMFLAALQTRVAAACVCCYLTSHRSTFLDRPHCTCGHLRDLAKHFEHVDIAAMIAPRPLFLEAGRRDDSFPYTDAEGIARDLRPIYDLYGCSASAVSVHVHGGGHEISGEQSIPWMQTRLLEAGS
jgi:dienelactone hydrolase